MIGFWMNRKVTIVSSVPAWISGWTKASPMKPPSGSTSDVIIGISSPGETLRKCGCGKRRMRAVSS